MSYLTAIIAQGLALMNFRADAGETAAMARQLEYVKAETYEVKYLNLQARELIPVDGSVPSGAQSFVWYSWDWVGMAKIIANYADDLPKVQILGKEHIQGIKSLGDSYDYSIQDIRAAAMAGVNLDANKAKACRRAMENKIEQLAAKGDSAAGLPGLLNNANVPVLTATELVGDWANPATTSAQILADLHLIANYINTVTKGTHSATTLVLPTTRYNIVATRAYSDMLPDTILQVFLRSNPFVREVRQWHFLDTADSAGTGPRVLAYEKSPEILQLVIPQEFEQFPPQAKNLAFDVPCHARIGGVVIRYPLAMVYADDV
jgi:hypothetical protein